MPKVISRSLEDTKTFAETLLERLSVFYKNTKKEGAAVLALYGDLGAGKTALTKELASLLGVRDVVNSPTFILEKIYRTTHPVFKRLVHIDAYRLEQAEELVHLGWEELVRDQKNLIVVEWAERVETLLPQNTLRAHALFLDEGVRQFHIDERKK